MAPAQGPVIELLSQRRAESNGGNLMFYSKGSTVPDASSVGWLAPAATLAGVVIGGGVTYIVQSRLQDRQKVDRLEVTRERLLTLLRIAEARFELVNRTGGYPIEREIPFERLITFGFSDDVASLVRARNAALFYERFAEIEQAFRSMWFEFAELNKAVERHALTDDRSIRQRERAHIEECRASSKAAAARAQELCRELRAMIGDLRNATLVRIDPRSSTR